MRSALSWPARPSAVLRDLAQSPDLPAPTRPTRRPTSDPAACWSLHCHQPQHRLLPTSLCRVEPLEQVPLERLDAGLGDGVAPTKAQLETPLLADVFAHDAVVLRALRGRLSTKSKLRRRGSRLRSLRSPHRSLPLRWLLRCCRAAASAGATAGSAAACGSVAGSTGYGLHPTLRPSGQPTLPLSLPGTKAKSSNTNRCWKCERDVGQYKHSRVAAASPSSRPPQAAGRLSSWPRLMAIPTPSPSRVAASPLFCSCCSRLRPPAPPPRRDSAVAVLV